MIYLLTADGLTPGGSIQHTFTHKQNIERHNENIINSVELMGPRLKGRAHQQYAFLSNYYNRILWCELIWRNIGWAGSAGNCFISRCTRDSLP